MGFGLESDAIHSPNENYPLENLFAGMRGNSVIFQVLYRDEEAGADFSHDHS